MQQLKLIIILIVLPLFSMATSPYDNISFSSILDNAIIFLSHVWHYKIISLETQSVTVANIITAIISLIIGLRLARYLSYTFKKKLFSLVKLDRNSTNLISRIVDYLF